MHSHVPHTRDLQRQLTRPDSEQLEGLQGFPSHKYTNITSLRRLIDKQATKLLKGHSDQQFLIFRDVSKFEFDVTIDVARQTGSLPKTRMTYFSNTRLLIIKIPTPEHERAHCEFGRQLTLRDAMMHPHLQDELCPMGSTTYRVDDSGTEADSSYKPISVRPEREAWPTIVIEAGVSSSLAALRTKAALWFANSRGDVKLVLIISVDVAGKTLTLEKWRNMPTGRRVTRQTPSHLPQNVGTVVIYPNPANQQNQAAYVVEGSPLIIWFNDVFLRSPNPQQGEGDFVFNEAALIRYATALWRSVQ